MTNNKAVLISGASTGIGFSTALLLKDNGFTVFAGVRKAEDFERLNSLGFNSIYLDITDKESVEQAYDLVKASGFELAGLINNAGVAIAGPAEFLPVEKYQEQINVNLLGHIAVTQKFMPLIRENKARIINITSIAGFCAFPFNSAYCVSKFGLEAYSRSLRLELKQWGVEVISVQPGVVETPIWEKSKAVARVNFEGLPSRALDLYGKILQSLENAEQKNMTSPEKVAEAVYTALSSKKPKSRYLVGIDAHFLNIVSKLPPEVLEWLLSIKLKSKLG